MDSIASITTSLGLGVPVEMSKLISSLSHIKDGLSLQIAVYLIWFMIFGWSVFRGLEGIKKLTDVNMLKIIFIFLGVVGVLVFDIKNF